MKAPSGHRNWLHVILVLCLGTPHIVSAQSEQARNLSGIGNVRIVIEDLNEVAKAAGITRDLLLTKTQLELRRIGIPTRDEFGPYLYVRFRALDIASISATVFDLSVSVHDMVIPRRLLADSVPATRREVRRRTTDMIATLWDKSALAAAPSGEAVPHLRSTLELLLDAFANDYLAANPRR